MLSCRQSKTEVSRPAHLTKPAKRTCRRSRRRRFVIVPASSRPCTCPVPSIHFRLLCTRCAALRWTTDDDDDDDDAKGEEQEGCAGEEEAINEGCGICDGWMDGRTKAKGGGDACRGMRCGLSERWSEEEGVVNDGMMTEEEEEEEEEEEKERDDADADAEE
ncbi:hypothetical protein BC567DRAFT_216191 [Phyllosticta citribraziliensis]